MNEEQQLRDAITEAIRQVREGLMVEEFRVDDLLKDQLDALSDEEIRKVAETYVVLLNFRIPSTNAMLNKPIRLALMLAKKHSAEELTAMFTVNNLLQAQPLNVEADGARLFFKRGQKAFEREEYSQAKKLFQRAVEIWPSYREAWCALAGTCELLGKTEEAANAFAKASELR